MVRCNVKGCERTSEKDKDHSFFLWPKDDLIRQQWKDFSQYEGTTNNLRICSDHFERQYLRKNTPPKRLLIPKAVPTILYPASNIKMPKVVPIEPPITPKIESIPFVDADELVNKQEIIFSRPALKDDCLHNEKDVFIEVLKATNNAPTQVNIEANCCIKVSLKGKRCCFLN